MKPVLIATVICLLGATQVLFSADEWPLAKLKETGKGDTALGAWSLAAFGGRDDGYLVDRTDLTNHGNGHWDLPKGEAGNVSVSDTNVNFRSSGKRNDAAIDSWLAALVFAPKEAGSYALSGTLSDLWCDNDGGKTSLKWAAYRGKADGKKFKLIVTGETGAGESVDLGARDELKSVALGADETVIVTLFKNGHWGAGSGNLTGIRIDKSAAKP